MAVGNVVGTLRFLAYGWHMSPAVRTVRAVAPVAAAPVVARAEVRTAAATHGLPSPATAGRSPP